NCPSALERIAHQDCVLPLRARREQSHRAAHQFFDASHILDRLRRQLRPGTRARGRLLPARDALVDRLGPRRGLLACRQVVDLAPVKTIAYAGLDVLPPVEDIELGEREAVDAAGANGLPHQHGVEPAAAPRPAGDGAELAPALADAPADLVVL